MDCLFPILMNCKIRGFFDLPVNIEYLAKIIHYRKIKLFLTIDNQELAQLWDWLLPMLLNGQVRVDSCYSENEEGCLGMVAEEKEEYKIK